MEPCDTLDEVRRQIDDVDRRLIALLAERTAYVREAARFKMSEDRVSAPEREERVLDRVRALASDAGLEPEIAEAAYRALFPAYVELQRRLVREAPPDG